MTVARHLFSRGCVIAAALSSLLRPMAADAEANPVMHLAVGGAERTYAIHVPVRSPPAAGLPLVLAFHGGGGSSSVMIRHSGLDGIADARGVIVVYPDGIDRHWNDGRSTIKNKTDDIAFVNAILDDVSRRYSVDRSRVFATGLSNGALFVHRLGCELSTRIAAIAAVAGPMPAELAQRCQPARNVSILQIEGDRDPVMPYAGGKVADFGGIGEGGDVLSTSETLALWSRLAGCPGRAVSETLPLIAPEDGTQIARTTFNQCRGGSKVELLTVEGGGHTWPGQERRVPRFLVGRTSHQLDAGAAIVDFFLSLPVRP